MADNATAQVVDPNEGQTQETGTPETTGAPETGTPAEAPAEEAADPATTRAEATEGQVTLEVKYDKVQLPPEIASLPPEIKRVVIHAAALVVVAREVRRSVRNCLVARDQHFSEGQHEDMSDTAQTTFVVNRSMAELVDVMLGRIEPFTTRED